MARPAPRLHFDAALAAGTAVALSPEHVRYLLSVLRLGEGAEVLLFNGRDGEWTARLAPDGKRRAAAVVEAQRRAPALGPDLTLCFAPLKRGPTELVVRMGTELGVRTFRPVTTARTQSDRLNRERLGAIATEAAEQCERLDVPVIAKTAPLDDLLTETSPLMFCDEAGDDPGARWGGGAGRGRPVREALGHAEAGPWSVVIGPEGGFTPEEREALRARANSHAVSLGPRILKAETAAVAALTLWGAMVGDLSG